MLGCDRGAGRPSQEGGLASGRRGDAAVRRDIRECPAGLEWLRSSYRRAWNFLGGGVRPGETPEAAARRELAEEIGLVPTAPLVPAGEACGVWDGRRDRVFLFAPRLDHLPELELDNREIIAARLVSPDELPDL